MMSFQEKQVKLEKETATVDTVHSSVSGLNLPIDEEVLNLLNNFSENNGSGKILRTISNSNNQTAPPRSGGC